MTTTQKDLLHLFKIKLSLFGNMEESGKLLAAYQFLIAEIDGETGWIEQ